MADPNVIPGLSYPANAGREPMGVGTGPMRPLAPQQAGKPMNAVSDQQLEKLIKHQQKLRTAHDSVSAAIQKLKGGKPA